MNRLYLYTKRARLSEVFLVQNEQTLSLCKRGKAVCLILSVQMYKTVHTSYMHTKSFNVGNWSVGFFPSKYNNFTNIHPICTRGIFVWNVLLYYVARQLQLLFWGLGAVVAIATWPKARQPCTLSTFEFPQYNLKCEEEHCRKWLQCVQPTEGPLPGSPPVWSQETWNKICFVNVQVIFKNYFYFRQPLWLCLLCHSCWRGMEGSVLVSSFPSREMIQSYPNANILRCGPMSQHPTEERLLDRSALKLSVFWEVSSQE